jgi:hypothetical protein
LRDLVIAIDHAGARVVPLDAESGTPTDSHRFSHHIDRKRHDADREETDPSDTQFFEAIAAAVAGARRIAVIGHGKGQSNEAGHLMAYLAGHHPEVHARVACELTADLPHSTLPQLLALARHALAPHAPSFTSAGVI